MINGKNKFFYFIERLKKYMKSLWHEYPLISLLSYCAKIIIMT